MRGYFNPASGPPLSHGGFRPLTNSGGGGTSWPLTFGIVTDIHYNSTKTTTLNRYYQDGATKLSSAVSALNTAGVDFAIFLGDLIDHGGDTKVAAEGDLDTIEAVYDDLTMDRYYVFGNHDLDQLSKAEFQARTGMTSDYYSFTANGVTFVVLDACYRSDTNGDDYDAGNFTFTNTYIPPDQRTWLDGVLSAAPGDVVVFCHQQLVEPSDSDQSPTDALVVENAATVRGILETYGNVTAVFTGHEHENGRIIQGGIPYYLMMAATEYADPANAYSIVTISASGEITIDGYGRQASYGYPALVDTRLWLEADTIHHNTGAGIGAATEFRDVSGNERHPSGVANEPSVVRSALNSLPAVSFDGTEYLDLPDGTIPTGSGTYHVIAVVYNDNASPSAKHVVVSQGNNSNDQYFNLRLATNFAPETAWWFNTLAGSADDMSNVTWHLVETVWDGTNRTMYVDGVQIAQDAPGAVKNTAATDAQLGGEWVTAKTRWQGRMAELIVGSSFTAGEASSIRSYLTTKWGL